MCFCDTRTRFLSQVGRSRFVHHRPPQLKFGTEGTSKHNGRHRHTSWCARQRAEGNMTAHKFEHNITMKSQLVVNVELGLVEFFILE